MDILDDLAESLKRTKAIEVKLTLLHKQSEANDFAVVTKKLSRRIDDAMGALIDEWAEQSSSVNHDIQQLNDKLSDAKQQLEKNVDNTQQIVDAIGHVDKLIFIAKSLLKP